MDLSKKINSTISWIQCSYDLFIKAWLVHLKFNTVSVTSHLSGKGEGALLFRRLIFDNEAFFICLSDAWTLFYPKYWSNWIILKRETTTQCDLCCTASLYCTVGPHFYSQSIQQWNLFFAASLHITVGPLLYGFCAQDGSREVNARNNSNYDKY